MNGIKKTAKVYGFIWNKSDSVNLPTRYHFNEMQDVVPVAMVKGGMGIDIGSGCGYDTYIMAKNNPSVKIVGLDISDGVYRTAEITSGMNNVMTIKGSVLSLPLKDNIFDFAYSFGVLHHIHNPKEGLLEAVRVLKKESPIFLYLYEDHSENIIKYVAVKMISILRQITVKISPKLTYFLCWISSPLVFIIFSIPAKFLRKFGLATRFANNLPFNFGRGFFSLCADLYDRFSAPVERRFSRKEVRDLFIECGFSKVCITKLSGAAGWVAWGYKK